MAHTVISYETNVMPIAGYYAPNRTVDNVRESAENYDYVTEDIFQKIKALGINLIIAQNYEIRDNPKKLAMLEDSLTLADKYQISMYINDARMQGKDEAEMLKLYSEYSAHPSLKGISVVDEPSTVGFPAYITEEGATIKRYAKMARLFNDSCDSIGYVNLLPLWDVGDLSDAAVYRRYIDEYVQQYHARQLSFDYYVFDKKGYTSRKGYFRNLSIIREKSLQYHIPFWSFIQAGSNWNDRVNGTFLDLDTFDKDNIPNQAELLWNVNTSLAYGAKGIEYFPLIQPFWFAYAPDGGYDYDRNGLIGAKGEVTKWYGYVHNANRQIEAVDEILLHAVSTDILAVGGAAQSETGIDKTSCENIISITASNEKQGCMMGVFDHRGSNAYYLVNYDVAAEQRITVHFAGEQKYQVISAEHTEQKQGDIYSTVLEAGAAELILCAGSEQ